MKLSVKIETNALVSVVAVLADLKEFASPKVDELPWVSMYIEVSNLYSMVLEKYRAVEIKKRYGKPPKHVTLKVSVTQIAYLHALITKCNYQIKDTDYIGFLHYFHHPLLRQFKTFSIQLRSSINQ